MQSESENCGGEMPNAEAEAPRVNADSAGPQPRSAESRAAIEAERQASAGDPSAFASEKDKKEFIDMCGRMEKRREYWQDTMFQLFAQEEEEDKRTKALLREAYVNEASYAMDEDFQRWKSEQNAKAKSLEAAARAAARTGAAAPSAPTATSTAGNSISNSERLQRWYDNDDLLALTPFAAVVPFPRRISEQGLAQVRATIDSTMTGKEGFVVEAYLLHPPIDRDESTGRGDEEVKEEAQGRLSAPTPRTTIPRANTSTPLHSGLDVLALLEADPVLAPALDQTPCLFLNDYPTFVSQEARTLSLAFIVILGGKLVAVECFLRHPPAKKTKAVETSHSHKWGGPSTSTGSQEEYTAASIADKYGPSIKAALIQFAEGEKGLSGLLQCTNFTGLVRMMYPKGSSPPSGAEPAAVEVALLGVAPLEVRDYELFTWRELKETAESDQLRERNRTKQEAQERRRREIEDGLRPGAKDNSDSGSNDATVTATLNRDSSGLPLLRFTWDWDQLPEEEDALPTPATNNYAVPLPSTQQDQPQAEWEMHSLGPSGETEGKGQGMIAKKAVHQDPAKPDEKKGEADDASAKPSTLSPAAIAALSAVGASLVTGVVVTSLFLRKGTK